MVQPENIDSGHSMPQMQREMLCKACYKQVKAWIDGEGLGLTRRSKQTKRPASRAGG
jgi:hypothetical protein